MCYNLFVLFGGSSSTQHNAAALQEGRLTMVKGKKSAAVRRLERQLQAVKDDLTVTANALVECQTALQQAEAGNTGLRAVIKSRDEYTTVLDNLLASRSREVDGLNRQLRVERHQNERLMSVLERRAEVIGGLKVEKAALANLAIIFGGETVRKLNAEELVNHVVKMGAKLGMEPESLKKAVQDIAPEALSVLLKHGWREKEVPADPLAKVLSEVFGGAGLPVPGNGHGGNGRLEDDPCKGCPDILDCEVRELRP